MPLHRIPRALADQALAKIERTEVVVAAFPEDDVYVIVTANRFPVVETRNVLDAGGGGRALRGDATTGPSEQS